MVTVKNLQSEKITVMEVEQRLRATLKGAFSGRPTPLKDIPKKKTPTLDAKGKPDSKGQKRGPIGRQNRAS